jgi:hypothetical protein
MVTARVALGFGALLALLAGCGGAAANADWVRTAEPGAVAADAPVAFEHEASSRYEVSELEPSTGPQRLDHTVTLGEVYAVPPSGAPAGPSGGTTTVVVNVNNMQPAYAPYYGGYGYGALGWSERGGSRPSPSPHGAGGSPVIPGQSWPAPASYGPSFPYSTSPASPWETKR